MIQIVKQKCKVKVALGESLLCESIFMLNAQIFKVKIRLGEMLLGQIRRSHFFHEF